MPVGKTMGPQTKITKAKGAGSMANAIDCLCGKHEFKQNPSSFSSTAETNKQQKHTTL
jgi:hypothetical protein